MPAVPDQPRILAICTANISRSPAVERLLRAGLDESVQIGSGGVSALLGEAIDPPVARFLRANDADVTGFAARQVTEPMVRETELVLTLTRAHRAQVLEWVPSAVRRSYTLLEFARVLESLDLTELPSGLTAGARLRAILPMATAGRSLAPRPVAGGDIDDAFARAAAFSTRGRVIAQEFLRGPEISVEGFCIGSEFHQVAITDKVTTGPPHFVEMGHSQPTAHGAEVQASITSVVRHAVGALGLTDCAVHAELLVTETGPRVVEIGARLGGDFITSHLVPGSTGVDMVGGLIRLACGGRPDLMPTRVQGSAVRFLVDAVAPPSSELLERLLSMDGVVRIRTATTRPAPLVNSSADRVGEVIATAWTAHEARELCDEVISLLLPETGMRPSPPWRRC